MMSGPNSPNFNPLDYQVWGSARVLSQAATEAKNGSRVERCTSVDLRKSLTTLLNTSAINCRLQACVSANDGYFEHCDTLRNRY